MDMQCRSVRESLSAIIDGEESNSDAQSVHAHLSRCEQCRAWHADVLTLRAATRREEVRVRADIAPAVMESIGVLSPLQRLVRGSRLALAFVALAQLVSAFVTLSGIHDVGHQGHELVMLEAALAIGFGAVALRPERAWGMAPLLVTVALGFVLTAGIDVVWNNASIVGETSHFLEIVGAVLVAGIARSRPASLPRFSFA